MTPKSGYKPRTLHGITMFINDRSEPLKCDQCEEPFALLPGQGVVFYGNKLRHEGTCPKIVREALAAEEERRQKLTIERLRSQGWKIEPPKVRV